MRVGLFFTGGHTEMGGLVAFLGRAFPGVVFERCFPARDRRVPLRRGAGLPAPRTQDEGVTGVALVDRMRTIIVDHHRGARYAAYLLVDDADCRFCGSPSSAIDDWSADLARRLGDLPTPVYVLLALQEVEAWLLADWSATFGEEFPEVAHELRRRLEGRFGAWGHLEAFGCPRNASGQGCTRKISDEIRSEMLDCAGATMSYSKRVHGQAMLARARPDVVGARCARFRVDLGTLRARLSA